MLILDLKPLRSSVKGKLQNVAVQGKKTVDLNILKTSRNGDSKIMQSI